MSLFLGEVAQRHADEFVLMVMDQAGWHLAGDLLMPANMRLLFLPPYSPELEPAEHLWEALRQDCCANHVFADLHAVERTLTNGLRAPETAPSRTQAMTGFAWITSMRLERDLLSIDAPRPPQWSDAADGKPIALEQCRRVAVVAYEGRGPAFVDEAVALDPQGVVRR